MEDVRLAKESLMAVDQALTTAATACRALVNDARLTKDPALKASSRKLLRLVTGMRRGPNVAVWEPLTAIDDRAIAVYQEATATNTGG